MKYRTLGNTDIVVSEIGMGCNTVAGTGTYGQQDEAIGIAAIKRAKEIGITFFDTAETYAGGRSEEALGKALGNDQEVIICSKVSGSGGPLTPESIRPACEQSLRRLQRDAIDVYLLHNPTIEHISDPRIKDELESLQRDGLVRAFGVSVATNAMLPQSDAVMAQTGYSAIELEFNMVFPEAGDQTIPSAQDAGIGIIVRVPLASGLLTGKYTRETVFPEGDFRGSDRLPKERTAKVFDSLDALTRLAKEEDTTLSEAALAWILSHKGVSTVIPGCRTPEQVDANAAASGRVLSQHFLDEARSMVS